MGLVCDESRQRCDAQRFVERLYYSNGNMRERIFDRSGLAYIDLRCPHCLTAVFAVMMTRHAAHCFAALHRLLVCGRTSAVSTVHRKDGNQHADASLFSREHPHQTSRHVPL